MSDVAASLVESVCTTLSENYVYPELASSMVARLQERLAKGDYEGLEDAALAQAMTLDLQNMSADKHVVLNYDPDQVRSVRQSGDASPPDAEARAQALRLAQRDNFGFERTEVLEANIGLLKLNTFSGLPEGLEVAVAAMNFLANIDALIIDLRRNRGGSTVMNQLLASYLFGLRPKQMTGVYWRPTDTHLQSWTMPHVPGKRLGGVPVFLVTSGRTFSAAEDFVHTLKHMKRATIVGEWTGGGAHPGQNMVVGDDFALNVPMGRPVSPREWGVEADWEGAGVEPDIEIPARDALSRARREAIQMLAARSEDSMQNRWYEWALTALSDPSEASPDLVDGLAGNYGQHRIRRQDGRLYLDWFGVDAGELVYTESGVFRVEGIKDYRVEPKLQNGKVAAIQEHYFDGRGLNLHPKIS